MSIGLSGGCEFMVHLLTTRLKHPDNGDIHCKADVRHCFQHLPRAKVLNHVYGIEEFSDIFNLLNFLYGAQSAMFVHKGWREEPEVIWSQQGVAQGCVLGSMLCCVYMTDAHYLPAQREALQGAPPTDLLAVGITDEVNFVGSPDRVLRAVAKLVESVTADGMELGTISIGKLLRQGQDLPRWRSSPPRALTSECINIRSFRRGCASTPTRTRAVWNSRRGKTRLLRKACSSSGAWPTLH